MFAIILFVSVLILLMSGLPVAWVIAGVPMLVAGIAWLVGQFDASFLIAVPARIFGIMQNDSLMSIPLFILMGMVLNRCQIAEKTLTELSILLRNFPAGLVTTVILFGTLLAACTGIVGAVIASLGLFSLPALLKRGYSPSFSAGLVCGLGTLGQIIPPSLVLILLTDVVADSYRQAQLSAGNYAPNVLSVGDMFAAAIIPGLLLVFCFLVISIIATATLKKNPDHSQQSETRLKISAGFILNLITPLILICSVLGSILAGLATITEAAAIGAGGALLIAGMRSLLDRKKLSEICKDTIKVTSMVFFILIAAIFFSLVFRGLGGDELIESISTHLPDNQLALVAVILLFIFTLGFILDFIEIIYILLPLVCPIIFAHPDIDPLWFGILVAMTLQTSFLTPPVGFSLFYLKGVAPPQITNKDMYKGVVPFIAMQLLVISLIFFNPAFINFLPNALDI